MKKKTDFIQIRAWKALLFSVLTLGIYSIVLLAMQRSRLPGEKPRLTHWGYYIAAVWLLIVGMLLLMVVPPLLVADTHDAAVVAVYGMYVLAFSMTVFQAYWTVRIISAINKSLSINMPVRQLALGSFWLASLMIVYEQSVINRYGKARQKQIGRLAYVTVCAIVIGGALVVLPEIMNPVQSTVKEMQQLYDGVKEDTRLYAEYEECSADLAEKYPQEKIPDDIYDEYSKEFDACEKIYQEYLKPKY